MALPLDCDADKVAEVAIGLMYLGLHGPEDALRAPKGLTRDVLDLLYAKGWISDPSDKSVDTVALTEEGEAQAALMYARYLEKQP
jgi:hypothetical protein